jgi:hypothetical protein
MSRFTRVGISLAASGLALTGAAVAPQLTSTASAGVATQTLKLVAHSSGSHNVAPNGFLGSDVDRSPKSKKVVGYDSISGEFNAKSGTVKIDAAVALGGGIITAHLTGSGQSNKLSGVITGGSGDFKGIQGTIKTHGPNNGNITYITFKYHF